MSALKSCLVGLSTKEVVTEYALDSETDKLKIVKQKVSEKSIPPNVDLLKLVFNHVTANELEDFNSMTDEELEQEKQKLLKQLKEEDDACRKSKSKS